MLRVVVDKSSGAELAAGLDELAREGARRMLAVALEAEVEAYIAALAGERDDAGRRLVVRNGHAKSRQVTTVAGAIEVHAPRVDDRRVDQATGQRCRFRSSILPPWCRRSPKVTEVLPLLYLHGLSSKDFVPALEEFFGTSAGLSASVVTRLKRPRSAHTRSSRAPSLLPTSRATSWSTPDGPARTGSASAIGCC